MSGTLVATIRREIQRALVSVSVSSGTSLPNGGATGTVLTKQSNADGDAIWVSVSVPAAIQVAAFDFDEQDAAYTYVVGDIDLDEGDAT